jgi:cell pole-organizing protein PopZ
MAQAAKSQEPSMEEILASIRRIIAEDDSEKPAQRPPETASVELNPDAAASPESRYTAPAVDSGPAPPAPTDDEVADEAGSLTQTDAARDHEGGGLMSGATSAAVDSAFNALAQTVLVHNARTLEDLVREMLRPMLKVWLDDNLPGMVERLVRAEIERVSRGRGG